ncbi:MAG: prepilin-type N-terminal cleavage/methylation domain-containing protein [Planctomycetes bacterium]|nr:prepilin-type N-terminal cleavage/methylation domain-containing protein [Planctomycetota bacterium]
MSTHPISRSRAGVTLIETMVALMILAIGLSAVFGAMLAAKKTNDKATSRALAFQEIQAQIETHQFIPFRSIILNFKGTAFDVKGLKPPSNRSSVGTVSRLSNPNPYDATLSPNPNAFNSSETKLPLRFRCEWDEGEGPMSVEVVYVVTYRGI